MILSQFIHECVPTGYEVSLVITPTGEVRCIIGERMPDGTYLKEQATYGLGPGDARRMDDIMLGLVARCSNELAKKIGGWEALG